MMKNRDLCRTVTLSLGEIEATTRRAVRGIGYPWGAAEEAAGAVRRLSAWGLHGVAAVVKLLIRNDGVPIHDLSPQSLEGRWASRMQRLCPVMSGAALSDSAALQRIPNFAMADVMHPLLLLPFVAAAAQQIRAPLKILWGDVTAISDGRMIHLAQGKDQDIATADVRIIRVNPETSFHPIPLQTHVCINETCWEQLNNLAARTYAPATGESRRLGAGSDFLDSG